MLNILHYRTGAANWTAAELASVVNQIKTNWKDGASGLKLSQSNDVAITRFTARDLSVANGLEVISNVIDDTGATNEVAMGNSECAVVTLGTGFSGRSFRGRAFIGGLNKSSAPPGDPNHLTAAVAASLAARCEYTFSNALPVGVEHVVLSRQANLAVRPFGIGTEITSYTVNTRLDNQRRRMPRV
jgi:hypothetical protein